MSHAADREWNAVVADLSRQTLNNRQYAKTLRLPDGDFENSLYDPDRHPGQRILFDALDAGATWVALLKPVQDGGSLASFAPVLRRCQLLGQSAIISYPTRDKAGEAWTNKIFPMLAAQGDMLPKTGQGSRMGSAPKSFRLPGGGKILLRSAGGRGESGQAADSVDCFLPDEVDDWPSMAVLKRAEMRISKSKSPFIFFVSTLKRDALEGEEVSLILRKFLEGTQSRVSWPCPECGEFHIWEHEDLDIEKQRFICPNCKAEINEAQRLSALDKPLRKDKIRTHKFSLMWTAADSPFPIVIDGRKTPVIAALCIEYQQAAQAVAMGDHSSMRQYFRDRWGRRYRKDLDEDAGQTNVPTRARLAALSHISDMLVEVDQKLEDGDSWHWCHIPAWAEHITLGADVQAGGDRAPGRIYFSAVGRGRGIGGIVGWGTIIAAPAGRQPTEEELHAALDRLKQRLADWAPSAPIVSKGVDIGDNPDELLRWLRINRDWFPIKGTGPMKPQYGDFPGWLYKRRQDAGHMLRFVEQKAVLRMVHGELLAGKGVGSLKMPQGLNAKSALITHLCASVEYAPGKWSERTADRKHHHEWQMRNDYADATGYARALAYEWENKAKSAWNNVKYGKVK